MVVLHDRYGYWLSEAGPVRPRPPLSGEITADVVIIGGGYLGMWTAWSLLERDPNADVVILERELCGQGPSGRNGGFVSPIYFMLPAAATHFGKEPALRLATAYRETVDELGSWCERERVDAHFRRDGELWVSVAPAQDERIAAASQAAESLGAGSECIKLDSTAVKARCSSPLFRCGSFTPSGATVQPALLARGLRERLLERGVRIYEHSPVRLRELRSGRVESDGGSVHAGSVVLAINTASNGLPQLRSKLTMTSSHIVATEPVPDLLEEIGWTGGESIADARTFLHYMRTTHDGRIVFGWGGGQVAFGQRGHTEIDHRVIRKASDDLRQYFPGLAGRRITHAWGGPIDVSPNHLPFAGQLGDHPIYYGAGFTGNGVSASKLVGKILAAMALGHSDPLTTLPIVEPKLARVPPEPFSFLGGSLVRAAMLRRERAEELSRRPGRVTTFIADLPRRMGIHLSR